MFNKGFSLIELLVVITIISVLLLLNFNPIQQTTTIKTASNAVMNVMGLAKNYAIANNSQVIFCVANNKKCLRTKNWQNNWLVFVDKNINEKYDTNERILLDGIDIDDSIDIYFCQFKDKIIFRANGRIHNSSFKIRSKNSNAGQDVIFYNSGRYRIAEQKIC